MARQAEYCACGRLAIDTFKKVPVCPLCLNPRQTPEQRRQEFEQHVSVSSNMQGVEEMATRFGRSAGK
jgi:hypothetical protein